MNTLTWTRPSMAVATIKSRRGNTLPWYLLGVATYALIFWFWQYEPVPLNVYLVAVLIFATSLMPLWRWYAKEHNRLPMVELIFLSYALQFSTPVFTLSNSIIIFSEKQSLPWSTMLEVLLYVELGLLALMLGYFGLQSSHLLTKIPQIDIPLTPKSRNQYYWVGLVMGGGLLILDSAGISPLRGSFGAIGRVLSTQYYVALILLAFEVFESTQPLHKKNTIFYWTIGIGCVIGLITGLLENALIPLILVLLVRWQVNRSIPWRWIAVAMFAFMLLNPAKGEYRRVAWYSGIDAGPWQKAQIWIDAITHSFDRVNGDNSSLTLEEKLREPFARLDLIHRFAWVRLLTPAYVPHYEGETYTYFFIAWVPRFLWPGKPIATTATNDLDLDYKLKTPEQASTSISIGQLPEAYANFGIGGVVLVMFLQGIIFALFSAVFDGRHSDAGRAIYLVQMVFFLNGLGTTTVVIFGGLLQNSLASTFILRLFTVRSNGSSSAFARRKMVMTRQNSRVAISRKSISL